MFNSYSHFRAEFQAIHELSHEDQRIYEARASQYRSRYIWSSALKQVWNNCLIHISPNVPGKVAYFATLENLRNNRSTRTSPEMFFQRYLENAPDDIKVAWEAEALGKVLPLVRFINNDEPQDWDEIYDEGPASCMKGHSIVRLYAHPENNLKLAYHRTDSGKILNRTIVNISTMAYARIYGENPEMFAASLRKLGYHHSGNETLVGEKIYVEYHTCPGCDDELVVGPYLDCVHNRINVVKDHDGKPEGIIGEEGDCLIYGTDDDGDYRCEGC